LHYSIYYKFKNFKKECGLINCPHISGEDQVLDEMELIVATKGKKEINCR
jgi:hypothetical protein